MDRKKQLIIAVVVAVVAVLANKTFIDSQLESLKPRSTVNVLRAKNPLKAGSTLLSKDVEVARRVPKEYAPKMVVAEGERETVLGQTLQVDVAAGDYILDSYFETRRAVGNKLSDQVVGENFRAITLPVDQTNSLAGSIYNGDKIDLIFTFSLPGLPGKLSVALLQNIPVIATGSYSIAEQELGDRGGRQKRYNTLTLLLSAHDAHRLNFASQVGKIDILLRNTGDSGQYAFTPIASVGDLFSGTEKELIERLMTQSSQGRLSDGDKEALRNQLREVFEKRK